MKLLSIQQINVATISVLDCWTGLGVCYDSTVGCELCSYQADSRSCGSVTWRSAWKLVGRDMIQIHWRCRLNSSEHRQTSVWCVTSSCESSHEPSEAVIDSVPVPMCQSEVFRWPTTAPVNRQISSQYTTHCRHTLEALLTNATRLTH